MATLTICSDFGAPQNKICHCFYFFSFYLPGSDGTDSMILGFWMLSFKPAFSLSSFTLIKRLFSSSSLSAIRVVSSAYMRLLIFLLAILIPACDLCHTPHLPGLLQSVRLSWEQATINPCLCQRLLDTHRQVWLSLLWVHCSFLLAPGEHKVLFVLSKSLCFPSSVKVL